MTDSESVEQIVDVDLLGSFKAMAAERGSFVFAVCELIDNSYDQDARNVAITINGAKRLFRIEDDGDGCEDLTLLVGLGRRRASLKNRIGMHGWGAKRALLYIAHDVSCWLLVTSHHKKTTRQTRTTFLRIGERRTLPVRPSDNATGRGTLIQLDGLRRKVPSTKAELGKLVEELGFVYSLAIEDSRRLIVNDVVIKAYAPPHIADGEELIDNFDLDDRRAVRLRVGVVERGQPNPRAGLHYRYGYRVIEASSSKGCGDYSVSRVFGYVDLLGDGWKLAALKDEIYGPGTLHSEVLRRIEPLLKRAHCQQMEVESTVLISNAEQLLNDAIDRGKTRKPRRPGKGSGKGTKDPTGRGTPQKDAKSKQLGNSMSGPVPRGRVHIDFAALETGAVGDVVGNTVRLNVSIDRVALARARGDAENIYTIAMFVYFIRKGTDGAFDARLIDDVLVSVGRALTNEAAPTIDGKSLSEAAE